MGEAWLPATLWLGLALPATLLVIWFGIATALSEIVMRVGHPAEQIAYMVDTEKVDAIVMGHRGESLLQRWLLGSVAKRVLSSAHCTVVIIRELGP